MAVTSQIVNIWRIHTAHPTSACAHLPARLPIIDGIQYRGSSNQKRPVPVSDSTTESKYLT
ncbi:hypothetical protein PILCRDRAFT_820488 [Piloderma croceum F 1598]|uniref:Uncharacterized protein n=1 Tax=Piloderma croceum (strain F 1598) TaxID=765440 RepID=A0A0C3FDW9_PILCF|nr:hypothetical protein PILCRDRAFT_820488 [Piloderma croceum F 1598]